MRSESDKSSIGIHKFSNHFSASHLLITKDFSEGLHGHNYYVEIKLSGKINESGLIINFLAIDKIITDILSEWDHYTLLPKMNNILKIQESGNNVDLEAGDQFYSIPKDEVVLLECENVTAEYLAKFVAFQVKKALQSIHEEHGIQRISVILWETPTYYATYSTQLAGD